MSNFWNVVEDPMYDEDGVLVDEDAEWDEVDEDDLYEEDISDIVEDLSPFETVNS
jgi:hypothetical protein